MPVSKQIKPLGLSFSAKNTPNGCLRVGGFTILELMISLVTLGVITSLAAPNLADFYNRQKISGQAESISSALSLARSAALSEATVTKVCWNPGTTAILVDGYSVVAGNLAVLADPDGDGTATAISDIPYSDSLFVADDEGDNCAEFTTDGRLDTDTVSDNTLVFGICKKAGDTDRSRAVVVAQTGRASVTENVNGAGVATINCS